MINEKAIFIIFSINAAIVCLLSVIIILTTKSVFIMFTTFLAANIIYVGLCMVFRYIIRRGRL